MSAKPRWTTTALILFLLITPALGLGWWLNHRSPTPTAVAPAAAPSVAVANFAPPKPVDHLRFGNPSNATPDAAKDGGKNYLLTRPQYALSYNNAKLTPNWVSWQLNASWIGTTPRNNNFRPDPGLPPTWYKVTPADYGRTGYDRGHMTPSADRDNTPDNESATYLTQGKELQIIAGPYGTKGTIGSNKPITVPETVWKIVLIMDKPGQSPSDIGPGTQVIAIEIPNEQGIKTEGWGKYRVTVDSLEQKTGYDFLSALPVDVQAKLESQVGQAK
jgi:endonuclease G, mitochondrial